jgi:mRNA (2'-O-methyladenosine-N6-)-methyltransferase
MDPPWILSSGNPTRGVATNYDTLTDNDIMTKFPFNDLQKDGFLFIWVINNKYKFALDLFEKNGYCVVDELVWVKQTVNGKIAKGHGYYLQHAKETCLIGYKGDLGDRLKGRVDCDVIFSQRRG